MFAVCRDRAESEAMPSQEYQSNGDDSVMLAAANFFRRMAEQWIRTTFWG
jgi:hypothetical protein